MGFLDDAIESYKPPVAEDLEIVLPEVPPATLPPLRVEQVSQAVPAAQLRASPEQPIEPSLDDQSHDADSATETRDLGQHGGVAESAQGSGTASTSSSTEPVPQRDDPDDGEHTDSTEEAVVARAQAARDAQAALAVEESARSAVEADDALDSQAPARFEEDEDGQFDELYVNRGIDSVPSSEPTSVRQTLAAIAGSQPVVFQKTGFSSGGAETLTVTRFPQALVDRLRISLAAVTGGEFAETLSSTALITGFLIAKTGVDLDVDANTAAATDIFRQVDPRLLAVESKIDEMMDDVSKLSNAMKLGMKEIRETGKLVRGIEFSQAYLIADRVAGLTTSDVDETNVDVTQKRVLVARESIRRRAAAQRTIERQREGRRLS